MKNAVQKLKHKAQPQRAAADKKKAEPKGPNWALLAVVFVFTALVTFGLFEYVLLSKLPLEILGKWVVVAHEVDPEAVGLTMEFHRDGSVTTKFPGGEAIPGRAKVEDDKLYLMIVNRNSRSREPITSARTLISLTDTHMELEEEGASMKLERPTEKDLRR